MPDCIAWNGILTAQWRAQGRNNQLETTSSGNLPQLVPFDKLTCSAAKLKLTRYIICPQARADRGRARTFTEGCGLPHSTSLPADTVRVSK